MLLLFIPLRTLVSFGNAVCPFPYGGIRDKTILLLRALKAVLPLVGLAGLLWTLAPGRLRKAVCRLVDREIGDGKWTLPAILVLAAVLRLGWILCFPTQLYAESTWYFEKAAQIAGGYGYVYDLQSRNPTAAWPVGYPVFLALFFLITGPSILVAKLLNVLLSIAVVYLSYLITSWLLDRRVAWISALLLAILPGLIVYVGLVSSDLLFMALVLAAFALSLRPVVGDRPPRRLVLLNPLLVGVIAGGAALTRPPGLVLIAFWAFVRVLTGRSEWPSLWRWASLVVVGALVVLAPWCIRNYIHFRRFVPISNNGGANFWIGNNPLAYGGYIFPRDDSNPLAALIGDEVALDEAGYRLGMEFIRQNPVPVLRLLPAKVFYLYNSNDAGLGWNCSAATQPGQRGSGPRAFMLVNLVYTCTAFFGLLGLAVMALNFRYVRPVAWSGVILTLYWTLAQLPFFGSDRFSLPLLPILTTYAAGGISALLRVDAD